RARQRLRRRGPERAHSRRLSSRGHAPSHPALVSRGAVARHAHGRDHPPLRDAARSAAVLLSRGRHGGADDVPRARRVRSARAALAVRTARLLYASIGARLRSLGGDPLRGRAVTPASWKLVLVTRALLSSLLEWPTRLWRNLSPVSVLNPVRFPDDVLPL